MSEQTIHEEIQNILNFLGRPQLDGQVKGSHISTILMYLQQWKHGDLQKTIGRLALRIGMDYRGIRENYIEGLEAEGIISVRVDEKNHGQVWEWEGLK